MAHTKTKHESIQIKTNEFIISSLLAEVESGESDSIDRLVARLSTILGLWINGTFPIIDLPGTATTGEVLAEVFKMIGFDEGHVSDYKVIETREVQLPGVGDIRPYIAVHVDTDLGEKIALLRFETYESGSSNWWSRVYNIKNVTKEQAIEIAKKANVGKATIPDDAPIEVKK